MRAIVMLDGFIIKIINVQSERQARQEAQKIRAENPYTGRMTVHLQTAVNQQAFGGSK